MRAKTDTMAPSGPAPADVAHALGERVKELNCLYGIARLGVRPSDSVEPVLREVANLLPPAWTRPASSWSR